MEDHPVKSPPMRTLSLVLGSLLWGLVLLSAYALSRPSTKPAPIVQRPVVEPAPIQVEDFEFVDRSGKTVTNTDLLGHPWLVSFIFTRCAGPCPRVTGQMKLLHDKLADTDVRFVTLTVDPKNDTQEVLAYYADAVGASKDRWLFLTGDQRKIYHLIQHSFQMPVREIQGEDRQPGFEILHSTNIMHVDAAGRVVGKYNALIDTDMIKLQRALAGTLGERKGSE